MQITVEAEKLDAISPLLTKVMSVNSPIITAANLRAAVSLDSITVQQLEELFEFALQEAFKAGEDFAHEQYEDIY